MMLYRQSGLWSGIGVKRPWCFIYREWSMVSCMELVRRDHDVVYQFQTIDHSVYTTSWYLHTNSIHETRDHSLSIQHHGLFTPILCMRTTEWSMVWNWCEKTMMFYIQRVIYGLMYGISEKRPWCCIDRVLYGLELVWKDHDVVYTEWHT
jgi:hypothetical protein